MEVVGCDRDDATGRVTAHMGDDSTCEADFLVGSDGIRSKVRTIINLNEDAPSWSGYTCFAAIS